MSCTTPKWVKLWLAVSSVIVLWGESLFARGTRLIADVGYCFLRPRSFGGGDLAWIWAPYK